MNPHIISKLPNVGTTIFTIMSSLASAHNAINLGQGFPDYSMDDELIQLVTKAMQQGHNQYAHMSGVPVLRQRISDKVQELYAASINPENEITITPGGTYAIYTALATILQKNDEVIVFEPAYDSYIPNIEANGAIAVPVSLHYPDYKINWQSVRQAITAKTKAIIINSPHNPTGKILNEEDINQLNEIVKGTGIFIISDEVYEHLIFDGKKHLSILKYPHLYKRSFVCFSFGKVYHCTGWKIGYCIAPHDLMHEFRKIHQYNCFSCHTPAQYALADFLLHKSAYLQLGETMQKKRDYFFNGMQHTKFKALPSHGSYFQLYSYQNISDEAEIDFAKRLVTEFGVAAIPVSAFYKIPVDNKVVRFCFAKKEDTLQKAIDRLQLI
ncbi:MAG: aminotransferase class I/II-fold pyridoxal phosphate-dependent enzyme [Bacteroidetes bacterium]|nr:aminotransferase class I/II-fold pyridoxal phosphate-dependent enzyme [Bacteroidota bacterium]